MLKLWDAPQNDSQRKQRIGNRNRNAVELSRHYIVWQERTLECKDCGRRLTENNFN